MEKILGRTLEIVLLVLVIAVPLALAMKSPHARAQTTYIAPPNQPQPTIAVQGAPKNSTATSAANAPVSIVIAAVPGQSARLFGLFAFCSAGTATLTVQDGATTVFSDAAALTHNPTLGSAGLIGSPGNSMTITLSACGATNTGSVTAITTQY